MKVCYRRATPELGRGRYDGEEHAIQVEAREGAIHLTTIHVEGDDGHGKIKGTANHIPLLDKWL